MEYEQIKQIIDDMGNSKLTSIDIEFPEGIKISMRKDSNLQVVETPVIKVEKHEGPAKSDELQKDGTIIKAPMVGTFYLRPSPDAKYYVEEGANVKKGSTLCVIEAMKLFNEIESEVEGKIVEILVKDGDVVEYGTPLFRIV